MSDKEKRGTKRTCQECEARFYDLNNTPITCPMCGVVFNLDEPEAEPVVEKKPEPVVKPAAVVSETADDADDTVDPVEDELAEIEADDSDDATDDEDNTFLESDDDDTDVSDMLGTPVTKSADES